MKKARKLTAIILALTLVMGVFAFGASAADEFTYGGYTYTLEEGGSLFALLFEAIEMLIELLTSFLEYRA